MKVSPAVEDYVKAVYSLQSEHGLARTSDLAKRLNVVPGTITNMVKKLEELGFVVRLPRRGVKLTESGEKLALDILRRYELSKNLLVEILGLNRDRAEVEGCKLEHHISDEIAKRIKETLSKVRSEGFGAIP